MFPHGTPVCKTVILDECNETYFPLFSFQCCLRDFPQAIFTSQSVELKGTLLGAEQKPANRGMFTFLMYN